MAPFRWPETRYDIALAIEVSASNPVKPKDLEAIAERLSTAFSTDTNNVQGEDAGKEWNALLINIKRRMLEL
jgi:hypothetical protein